jgi:hypothetical protein
MQSAYDRWATAGPPEADEVTIDVTCGEVVSRRFVTPDLERAVKALALTSKMSVAEFDAAKRMFREAMTVVREWQRTDVAEDVTCTFDGEVEAMVGQGRVTWTCPCCGTEHDEDEDKRFPGPDPDRFHDDR